MQHQQQQQHLLGKMVMLQCHEKPFPMYRQITSIHYQEGKVVSCLLDEHTSIFLTKEESKTYEWQTTVGAILIHPKSLLHHHKRQKCRPNAATRRRHRRQEQEQQDQHWTTCDHFFQVHTKICIWCNQKWEKALHNFQVAWSGKQWINIDQYPAYNHLHLWTHEGHCLSSSACSLLL